MKKLFVIIISAALIFPAFTGCKKTSPPKRGKTAAKAVRLAPAPAETLKPIEEKEEIVYVYDSKGRRSPFRSLVQITKKKKGQKGVAASPLESFDASDFQLLAVAGRKGRYTALLLAPDKKSYTVREGASLGLHDGKVTEVSIEGLIIEEYIMDYRGELKPNKIVLELRKGEVIE